MGNVQSSEVPEKGPRGIQKLTKPRIGNPGTPGLLSPNPNHEPTRRLSFLEPLPLAGQVTAAQDTAEEGTEQDIADAEQACTEPNGSNEKDQGLTPPLPSRMDSFHMVASEALGKNCQV